ncbi:tape measure protein [Brucella cytisi]|uniref:Phage tail tape measure protein n=1 Tax=Brucella cytisi TaxID=407152 RepID=A0A1J6HHG1_9HYPH|nr:tape measure protein [Brucella cytisi]OIS91929.1 phage tail tape measure protein [Brucella cytisi]
MATDIEKLVVQLSADFKSFERSLARANNITNAQFNAIERRARSLNRNLDGILGNTFRNLAGPAAGIGAALGTREIIEYADAWTEAGNKIRAAAQIAGVQTRSLNQLKDGANAARADLTTYVDLYAKLIRSASAVAKSEQEIATATDIVTKAFKAGGASTQEQIAGILQLSQALGSGVLQGDELRSIRENAPIIAKAIADEFKVSIAGLKKLGEEGKLTTDRVFKAILNAQKPIEAAFAATNATIKDAFTRINNEFTAYIGNADQSAGASARLVESLQYLADNFKHVADAAVAFATVAIAALTGRALGGMVIGIGNVVSALGALLTAFRAGVPLAASFSAALGPIGLLAGAAAASLYLMSDRQTDAEKSAKAHQAAVKELSFQIETLDYANSEAVASTRSKIAADLDAAKTALVRAKAERELAAAIIKEEINPSMSLLPTPEATDVQNTVENSPAVKDRQELIDKLEEQIKDYEGKQQLFEDYVSGKKKPVRNTEGFGGGIPVTPDDKKKGRSKKTPAERFDDNMQRVTDRTAALIAETEAQRQINPLINDYGYAMEKARTEQELLNAAQKAGVALTPELRAQISATADQWALASAEANKLAEAQNRIKETAEDMAAFQKDLVGGIADDFLNGAKSAEIFANALGRIAQKLIDIGLANIFDTDKGGFNLFGALGSIFRKNGGPVKRAGGGIVRGPGGPRGDKIPAMLSDEEFVVNAAATKRNRALLEAINSGRVIGLKDGGSPLRAPSMPILRSSAATQQAQSGIADVRVFVDRDGNWQAEVERISQRNVKQGLASYDKSGAVRTARDLRQVNSRGLAK